MKFGVSVRNTGHLASKNTITRIAVEAERLGYDSLSVADHTIVPPEVEEYAVNYEAITTLSYVAAVTEDITLCASVIVLPLRNPVVVAKQAATLDVLCGGRLVLGVGVGWLREEFEMLGVDFDKRSETADEGIKVMRTLWREENPIFEGKYTKFDGGVFLPKPLQKNGPPIWIGGNSVAAIRRAALLGDGWNPLGLSPADLDKGIRMLKSSAQRRVTLTARNRVRIVEESGKGPYVSYSQLFEAGRSRVALEGAVNEVSKAFEDLSKLELEHFGCIFSSESLDDLFMADEGLRRRNRTFLPIVVLPRRLLSNH